MHKTLTVSLLGGPGTGKSTMAAGIFHELKMAHVECELVTEFAKYLTWEKNHVALGHQFYVTAKQMHREFVVNGQVDVLITDSPTIIGLMYYNEKDPEIKSAFENFIVTTFKKKWSLNIFINRMKRYNPNGRNQTEEEAKKIDDEIKSLLLKYDIPFIEIPGNKLGISMIVQEIEKRLAKA